MQPDIIANKQNSNKDNLFFILSCIFPFSSEFTKTRIEPTFKQKKKRSEKSPPHIRENSSLHSKYKINNLYTILDFLFFPV
ncbi:hypothetical protein D8S85_20485 [Butyricimonas faecalis]|uniref:Uncharacterized protein n=1 Tax=Butyricimonas faecalis TaxID=2093856 RepID=A0A3S9VYV8_9BACT|nr:hypothetical protein D8S85_20485 [Butyricimonas faecalis]